MAKQQNHFERKLAEHLNELVRQQRDITDLQNATGDREQSDILNSRKEDCGGEYVEDDMSSGMDYIVLYKKPDAYGL